MVKEFINLLQSRQKNLLLISVRILIRKELLFPQLKDASFGHVNLEKEAEASALRKKINGKNQLLNPEICQQLIDEIHRRYELVWSYGGWMENRPQLWADSYLEEEKKYLHLGVDYNVPAGVEVVSPWEAEVIDIEHDQDRDGGWGGRVILNPLDESCDGNVFIFGHLSDDISVKLGEVVTAGKVIGTVGLPEVNGGWFSHLHVQAMIRAELERLLAGRWGELDGYGRKAKRRDLAIKYPDPTRFIPLG